MVVYGDLAVITRPGRRRAPPRDRAAEAAVRARGYRIARIEAPGTLDGGDVLKHGGTVWVGHGGRTNAGGLAPVAGAPCAARRRGPRRAGQKVLHLKSAVTALPDGTVVGHAPLVDDPTSGPGTSSTCRRSRAPTWCVLDADTRADGRVRARVGGAVRAARLHVVTVDISEFEKMEGCVTCLSVRLRGVPG